MYSFCPLGVLALDPEHKVMRFSPGSRFNTDTDSQLISTWLVVRTVRNGIYPNLAKRTWSVALLAAILDINNVTAR
jgi:hypothetical protein